MGLNIKNGLKNFSDHFLYLYVFCESGFGGEGGGGIIGAGSEFFVEHVEPVAVVADFFEGVDESACGFLFLNLLADEPLEGVLCGVVFFLDCDGIDVVDKCRYLLLVGEGCFEGVDGRCPFGVNPFDGGEEHFAVA